MDSKLASDDRRPGEGRREGAAEAPNAAVAPAPQPPGLTSPAAVLALQRSAGNQAVARLVGARPDTPAPAAGGGGGPPPAAPPPAAPAPAAPAPSAGPAAAAA